MDNLRSSLLMSRILTNDLDIVVAAFSGGMIHAARCSLFAPKTPERLLPGIAAMFESAENSGGRMQQYDNPQQANER